jgi:CubicO group peptidase (beta-lactamase class C family)
MKHYQLLLALALCVNFACRTASTESLDKPTVLNDGIETATLSEVKMDVSVIGALIDSIESGFYPNRHSLLIAKNGKLVLEKYFPGPDNLWGRDLGVIAHGDTVLHDVRSISKSIVSACIGIAIAQGKITTVDQKVFDFFKEFQQHNNEGREALTIRHLLTMTSGLAWNEEVPYDNPENSEIQMTNSDDPIEFVLSRDLATQPGTAWKYNGGTTQVLARIIERTTGKNVYEFAKTYLFAPLGITRSSWITFPGTNDPAAASGLRLTSRDVMKFGMLYQSAGKWKGEQVLPESWVNESFTSYITRPDGGGYGYQFWIFSDTLQNTPMQWPVAVGNGDQRIFFDGRNGMVVVMTAGNYNKWDIENNSVAILRKIYKSLAVNTSSP